MGSNLGPTLAAFAMDLIESQLPFRPRFYKRYVDDIFAIFDPPSDACDYLTVLNARHPNIQFTMEPETNGSLNFLDVNVSRKNNALFTKWIIKPTNTGRYIPYHSYSPNRYKQSAIRSLIYRSKLLNSSDEDYKTSYNQIKKKIFKSNGYPDRYIDEIKRSVDVSFSHRKPPVATPKFIYWRLPYIKSKEIPTLKSVNSINKILPISHRLRVVFKTFKTSDIFPNKDQVPPSLASNVVYKFQCEQCSNCYIGETRRHLSTRIKEHLSGQPIPSEITKHEHTPQPANFKIIFRTKFTKIAETILINSTDDLINEQQTSIKLYVF